MIDSDYSRPFVGLNSRPKRDNGSKTKERKNSATKDQSFDVTVALPFIAMLNR